MFHDPQVILFSENVERSATFYSGLGFVETFQFPRQAPRFMSTWSSTGTRSESSRSSRHAPITASILSPTERAAMILWADDVDTAYESMTAAGCPGIAEPHIWLDRLRIAWLADPDGHPIQIVQSL